MTSGPVVCFDLGGVLVRITLRIEEAARAAGIAFAGPPMRFQECACFCAYQAGDLDDARYLEGLAAELKLEGREQALRLHEAIILEPYSGTLELILRLRDAGVRLGCLSNTNAIHWEEMHDARRFANFVLLDGDLRLASHELRLEKPDPAIYEAFVAKANVEPGAIYFFDDGAHNVEGARACGWNAFLVDPEGDPAAQMGAILADLQVLGV